MVCGELGVVALPFAVTYFAFVAWLGGRLNRVRREGERAYATSLVG